MKKRYLAVLVFGIMVAAGLGIFILYEMMPHHYENINIPPGFLYKSKSDKLPEQYLIYYNNEKVATNFPETGLIYKDGKFYCNSSGTAPGKIEYFSYSPGANMIGGWYYRYALVCGNNYWIVDADDSFGQKIYGSFTHEWID